MRLQGIITFAEHVTSMASSSSRIASKKFRQEGLKMGTWGEGNYENDDALDWVSEIVQAQDLTPVTSALQAVTQVSPGAYLEAPHCSRALAAIEVLAALKGSPSDDIPDDLEAWIAEHRDQDPAPYLAEALAAIHLIRNASELKDLMDEAGMAAAWFQVLDDLYSRLAA